MKLFAIVIAIPLLLSESNGKPFNVFGYRPYPVNTVVSLVNNGLVLLGIIGDSMFNMAKSELDDFNSILRLVRDEISGTETMLSALSSRLLNSTADEKEMIQSNMTSLLSTLVVAKDKLMNILEQQIIKLSKMIVEAMKVAPERVTSLRKLLNNIYKIKIVGLEQRVNNLRQTLNKTAGVSEQVVAQLREELMVREKQLIDTFNKSISNLEEILVLTMSKTREARDEVIRDILTAREMLGRVLRTAIQETIQELVLIEKFTATNANRLVNRLEIDSEIMLNNIQKQVDLVMNSSTAITTALQQRLANELNDTRIRLEKLINIIDQQISVTTGETRDTLVTLRDRLAVVLKRITDTQVKVDIVFPQNTTDNNTNNTSTAYSINSTVTSITV